MILTMVQNSLWLLLPLKETTSFKTLYCRFFSSVSKQLNYKLDYEVDEKATDPINVRIISNNVVFIVHIR